MTQGGAHSRGAGQREPSRARQARAGIAALLGNRPALMTTKRPAFPGSGVLARQVLVLSVQCNVVRIEEDDTRVSCVPEAPSQRLLSLFVDRSQEPLPAAAPGAQGSRQGHPGAGSLHLSRGAAFGHYSEYREEISNLFYVNICFPFE